MADERKRDPADRRNPVYDRLLGEAPDDLEGLVAYALYKRHKRRWAADHRIANGSDPTIEDELGFAISASTPDQLDRYRQGASDMLVEFASVVVQDRQPEISRQAVIGRVEDAAKKIEDGASFTRQIGVALVSTVLTTLILVGLTIAASLFGVDPLDGLRSLTDPSRR